MLTKEDYFGSQKEIPAADVVANSQDLLMRVNALMVAIGMKAGVASGWRSPAYNAEQRRLWIESGGAKGANTAVRSRHMEGNAIDLTDTAEQQISNYLLKNQGQLVAHGLYLEHPSATKGRWTNWCHLQRTPPKSGSRVFYP